MGKSKHTHTYLTQTHEGGLLRHVKSSLFFDMSELKANKLNKGIYLKRAKEKGNGNKDRRISEIKMLKKIYF